jgi:hypothetical protein
MSPSILDRLPGIGGATDSKPNLQDIVNRLTLAQLARVSK